MAGILDTIAQYMPNLPGILNAAPDPASLPGEAGINVQLPADPYGDFDRKRQAEAAARAAAGVFASGAAPIPAVGVSGQQVMNVGPFGALAPMLPTGAPDAAPALPAAGPAPAMPAASAVPLPRPRPATAPAANAENANDETLPANAAPTQGQGPPGQPPAPVPETSLLGRIGHALQGADAAISPHTATLLALAGGLAGAPSWGTGISRGFTAAAAALPEDQRLAMQQGGMRQTFQALREQGVPPQLALASVYNPDILKSTLSNYVTDRQWQVKTVKDMLGNERLVGFNPYTQETKELSAGAGGAGGSQGSIGMLAPGVSSIDSSLTGDAYMAQFSPEVQAAARAYANGDTMPTGNPRQQGITTLAKTVAQKWGQDMNIPVNDATFAEKRKLKTDLASSGNSSMGGILSNGESSFSHLAELGESMSGLGNASHDFPGGGTIAAAQNYAGNVILPSSARKAQVKATDDNLSRYGQESTKFYAGSGGGETERMQARHDMNPGSASSEEMAAYLEKEKSLMLDRLNTKFGQIRQTLGEDEGNRVIAQKMPSVQQNIDRISASIQKLRGLNGGAGETSPAAAPMQINSKTDYDRLPKGATYVAPDGSMRTKQ